MAGELIYLEAIIGADISSFRRGMAEVRGEIAETTGLSGGLIGLGSSLTLGLTVPILALGAVSLKTFSDFDSGMRNINSIMQLPEDQLQKLSDAVLKFGENTRNGATAATSALYTIVSAGFGIKDTAEAMKVLDVATMGAEAGLADTNTVAQLLAQSLLAYGQGADSASHFMDVLTQTVNLGVGSMDDVAGSIGQVINISALAGVSFDDLGGSAAFLTQRGMSFANAATSLNQILSQLIKPTEGLTAAYKELGVANGTELIQRFGGLGGALQALGSVSGTSADDLAKLFTNVRALRGAASILGNFDDYTKLMNDFGTSIDGVTGRAQQQQLRSLASQFDYMKSHITAFLTTVGKDLAPLFGTLTDVVGEFVGRLNDLDPVVVQNAVKIGLLVAAIPPLIVLLGALLSPIGQLVIVGGILIKAWNDNFLGIQDAVKNALPVWNKGLNDLHLALITFYTDAGQTLYNIKTVFDEYLSNDMAHLLQDLFIGNWEKARTDFAAIIVDFQNLIVGVFGANQLTLILVDGLNLVLDAALGDWTSFKTDLITVTTEIEDAIHEHLVVPIENFVTNDKTNLIQYLADLKKGIDIVSTPGNDPTGQPLNPIISFDLMLFGALGRIKQSISDVATWSYGIHFFWQEPGFLDTQGITFSSIYTFFDQNFIQPFTTGIHNIEDLFERLLKSFLNLVTGYINGVIDGVNQAIGTLNILMQLGAAFTGGQAGTIGLIPHIGETGAFAGATATGSLIQETTGGSGTPFPSNYGFGTGSRGSMNQTNQVTIVSNDPDHIIQELNRRGVLIPGSRRG